MIKQQPKDERERHGAPRVMASAPSVVQQARLMDVAGTAWHAVKCGNLEMITKLFPNQSNVYARGPVGENVMHVAMLLNTPSTLAITRYLVKLYGSQLVNCPIQERNHLNDPPGTYEGQTALHIAIVNRDFDMVKFLVQHGANIRARAWGTFFRHDGPMYYGEYPLSFAACTGQKDVVAYLKRHGAQVNTDRDVFGNTALHMCVIHNQADMYDFLVEYCAASDEVRNHAGLTPLVLAAQLGKVEMLQHIYNRRRRAFYSFGKVTSYSLALHEIDTVQDEGRTGDDGGYVPNALEAVLRKRHLDMLQEPLLTTLLQHKWEAFARAQFLIHFAGYLLLEVSQTILIWLISSPTDWNSAARVSQEFLSVCLALIMLLVELLDYANWSRECYYRRLTMTAHKEQDSPLYPTPGETRDAHGTRQGLFARISARMGFAGHSGTSSHNPFKTSSLDSTSSKQGANSSHSPRHKLSAFGRETPTHPSGFGAQQQQQQQQHGSNPNKSMHSSSVVQKQLGLNRETPPRHNDDPIDLRPLVGGTLVGDGRSPRGVAVVDIGYKAAGPAAAATGRGGVAGAAAPQPIAAAAAATTAASNSNSHPAAATTGPGPLAEGQEEPSITSSMTQQHLQGSSTAAGEAPLQAVSRHLSSSDEASPSRQVSHRLSHTADDDADMDVVSVGLRGRARSHAALLDAVDLLTGSGGSGGRDASASSSTAGPSSSPVPRAVHFSDQPQTSISRASSGRLADYAVSMSRAGSGRANLGAIGAIENEVASVGLSHSISPSNLGGLPGSGLLSPAASFVGGSAADAGVKTSATAPNALADNTPQQAPAQAAAVSSRAEGASSSTQTAAAGNPATAAGSITLGPAGAGGDSSTAGASQSPTPAATSPPRGPSYLYKHLGGDPSGGGVQKARSFHEISSGGSMGVGDNDKLNTVVSWDGASGPSVGPSITGNSIFGSADMLKQGFAGSSTTGSGPEALQMIERQRTKPRGGGGDLPALHSMKRSLKASKKEQAATQSLLGLPASAQSSSTGGAAAKDSWVQGTGGSSGRFSGSDIGDGPPMNGDPEKGAAGPFRGPHKTRFKAMLETTYEGAVRMADDPWLFVWHFHLMLTLIHFITYISTYDIARGAAPTSLSVREFDDIIVSIMGLSGWLAVIYFFRGFRTTGKLAVVLERCIADVCKFVSLYVLWNLGFTLAFYTMQNGVLGVAPNQAINRDTLGLIELSATEPDPFDTIGYTMITLINLGTGLSHYEYSVTCKNQFVLSTTLCTIYYLLYMATVVLLLMNLLTAMVITTWNSTQGAAEAAWKHRWALYVVKAERRLPARWVQRLRLGQLAWDPKTQRNEYSHVFETVDEDKGPDTSKSGVDSQIKSIEAILDDLKKRRGSNS